MNRIAIPQSASKLPRQLLAVLLGFACTVPALANVPLPNTPLQSGSAIPPNVMVVFDDSGSMAWRYLYIHNDFNNTDNGNAIYVKVSDGSSGTNGVKSQNTGDEKNSNNLSSNSVAPSQVGSYSGNYLVDQSYATNGIYYNPAVTYSPWHYPNGTLLSDSSYQSASEDANDVDYTWSSSPGNADNFTTSSGTNTNLKLTFNTFFVPKTAAVDTSDAKNYYRFQMLTDGTIWRSDLIASPTDAPDSYGFASSTWTNQAAAKGGNWSTIQTITVTAGTTLTVKATSGTNLSSGTLYVQFNANPTTSAGGYVCQQGGSTTDTCTITPTVAGTYYIGIYDGNATKAISGVTLTASTPSYGVNVGCHGTKVNSGSYGWGDCTETRPALADGSKRSVADEKLNFANWYTYYQTRIKTAKAGLSSAFSNLGTSVPRVGFWPITCSTGCALSNNNNTSVDVIPVQTDDGLFRDVVADNTVTPAIPNSSNKSHWFKIIIATEAAQGTYLRNALDKAGTYYSDNATVKYDATNVAKGIYGPYGPEAGTNQLACRANFTILTTDGYWNDSFTLADQDSGTGPTHTGGPTGTGTYTFPDKNYYKDAAGSSSYGNMLADVAMKYWKNDLMTGMADKVVPTTSDPAWWQHMTTFTISIGANGTLPVATVNAALAANTTVNWPQAVADKLSTIDDLFHTAVNGHGSFVVASDPNGFVGALTSALAAINQATSSSSNLATTSALLQAGTLVYRASFVNGLWTGDLSAYAVDPTTRVIATTATWSASMPAFGSRNLFTWSGTTGTTFPTAAQVTSMGGASIANYIKGDRSSELPSGAFRKRGTTVLGGLMLGDLIDSSPVYVPGDITVTPNIPAMLYVGGNDGFMHAINAATGAETFAYAPAGLSYVGLGTLSDPKYVHQYFVDGSIVVSTKTQTKSASDSTGKNILVGTLGRGGHTVYALDVSDPNNFGAGKVLWEYTNSEMGNSLSTPVVTKLNIPDVGDGNTGVIISNGYNSASGHSQIFILNIRTGALVAELDSKAGDTTTNSNGMATPTGWDADRSGTVDLLYAGDLLGNVWEFDVSAADPTTWKPVYGTKASPLPLYIAKDPSGNRQPITGGLAIGLDTDFNRWVFFGTGRYLSNGDPADLSVQSWYGLIDPGPTGTAPYPTPIPSVGSTRNSSILKQRTITAYGLSGTNVVRTFSQATAGDMTGKKGWYLDFLGNYDKTTTPPTISTTSTMGERVISDPTLLSTVLLVASVTPSQDACDIGGSSFINALDAFTGAAVSSPFFDSNGDGVIDGNDVLGSSAVGSVSLGVGLGGQAGFLANDASTGTIYQNGTGGQGSGLVRNPTNSGRISWREIIIGN